MGALTLSTAAGQTHVAIDVPSSDNVALMAVTDAGGTALPGYEGAEPLAGTENAGFTSFAYVGAPGAEAAEVRLVIGALEQGPSSFFLDVTDTCQRTLHVDPFLELLPLAQEAAPGGEVPAGIELDQNYPNPFNPTTTIRFALDAEASVRLVVYDLQGRVVQTLVAGGLAAGTHEAVWDGRAAGGGRVPSGTYSYRLEVDGKALTRQMVLVQ
jgi:hypothetical protein